MVDSLHLGELDSCHHVQPYTLNVSSPAMLRWFGAAAIVVGVAAQYLELHPDAPPSQVRQALLTGWTTNHSITSVTSTNAIIFTNFTQSAPADLSPLPASSTGRGLSTGAIVGVAVAVFLGRLVLTYLKHS